MKEKNQVILILIFGFINFSNINVIAQSNNNHCDKEMIQASVNNEMPPVEKQIIDGISINPDIFPWTLKFCFLNSQDNQSLCTATVVGERVIFVAAHCKGSNHHVRLIGHNEPFKLKCTPNPQYDPSTLKGDLMICSTDRKLPTLRKFESVSLLEPKENSELFFLGYGCRDLNNKNKSIGVLMGGNATINRIDEKHIITKNLKNQDELIVLGKDVMVCPGDSGGGVYLLNDSIEGTREIVGVVSAYFEEEKESYITAFFLPENKNFIKTWNDDPNFLICGIHENANNCR